MIDYEKVNKVLELLIKYYDIGENSDEELIYEEAERPSEIIAACANAMSVID